MIYEVRTLKRLSTFIALILFAAAVVVPSLKVFALYDYKIENTAELSIPDNIGIEIPETNEGVPIIGIIMWALVAVVAMAALIVIFANISGANSIDKSVRRERYKKKSMKKSKYSKYK